MANELQSRTVAFVVANEGVEEAELTSPWEAVVNAGGRPVLVAPEVGDVQAFQHLTPSRRFQAERTTAEVSPGDFDGVVLPGGVANADQLRADGPAVDFVRSCVESGVPVAAVCHAPWTLIEAGVVEGRTMTSWPSLQTDIRNAGGTWVDEEVQVCTSGPNVLVTSRKPDDLPAFNRALVAAMQDAPVRSA